MSITKRYKVVVYGGLVTVPQEFYSRSRNAKQHIIDTGATDVKVYDKKDNLLSAARLFDNKITCVRLFDNKITYVNCFE